MFDCGYKSQYIGGKREKFVRLDDLDSTVSMPSHAGGMKGYGFNFGGLLHTGHARNNESKSFRIGVKKGSEGLRAFGKSIRFGVTRAVFPEDLTEKNIFDPQDKSLQFWNKLFVISCILAVSVDPLFFYLPVFNTSNCLGIDKALAALITTVRTILDVFYLIRMGFQFRTAYTAPSSRVFGRGELVIDPAQIAMRYLKRYFIVDLLAVIPAPQIFGALWYLLAVERKDTCWQKACAETRPKCIKEFLYCGNKHMSGYNEWRAIMKDVLGRKCNVADENLPFNFGIYTQAISSDIVSSRNFFSKFFYCLWWGLQNLSTLGQGLQTSTYTGEVLFSIVLAISGLILFALLIGNMQTYLQSLSIRLEEMRIKRRDSEQWMHHRLLPQDLRERVRRYDQYKWLETRGVDEESLVQSLPKDLRRDIKRHLCLNLVRRVPLFANMDERLLDAICERLKPSLYTESTYIVREGDPVNEMMFIIRGRLESVTTDGGRSGFYNRGFLKEGDFCGEELLTWALDPKAGANLPLSTRTVSALTEVEAFALEAEELKFVASQFRRLHSRQVQHTFRFYSQQWRTWAACFIQSAWRRYMRRKHAELRRLEEEEEEEDYSEDEDNDDVRALVGQSSFGANSSTFAATILASRFAANALRGHRLRVSSSKGLAKLQKPPEPDFTADAE
ncbi:hypothetical protein BT93_L5444 [Corymbia citriodora subsp. variegata]|nr:hypothetical protein BT93_L5444 [Corymbia citriodora subsp. variegata]KAF7850487.1 hypothetical protein BT93_L5444 [Corymbia citriodora subsp. variegata]